MRIGPQALTVLVASGMSLVCAAYAETKERAGDAKASAPLVAVPEFENRTDGNLTRIVPGKYRERNVRVGSDQRSEQYTENGKQVQTSSSRDVHEKLLERDVEYAPGPWKLPESCQAIAADEVARALTNVEDLFRHALERDVGHP